MEKSQKEIKKRIIQDLRDGHFNHAKKVLNESKEIVSIRLYRHLEKEITLCDKYKDSKKIMRYVYFSGFASTLNFFLYFCLTMWIKTEMGTIINSLTNTLLVLVVLILCMFNNHLITRFVISRMGQWNYVNKFGDFGGAQLLIIGTVIVGSILDIIGVW